MTPEIEPPVPFARAGQFRADECVAVAALVAKLDARFAGEAILGVPLDAVVALAATAAECRVIDHILDLRPQDLGIDTPATTPTGHASEASVAVVATIAIDDVAAGSVAPPATADGVVRLVGQTYWSHRQGRQAEMRPVLIASSAVTDFIALQRDATAAVGRPILVMSQHRSRGHQVAVILRELVVTGGDLDEVLRGVALPGFSEHQALDRPAFDFGTYDGKVDDAFRDSAEYAWLMANAARYRFVLSYPDDNTTGIKSEPWHWRHEPPAI